ncbi:MAG: DUF4147 domain-containing protein, partial [Candidatus Dormibacteraeota bacterium]|nr:DUF4147 domain-containing protein [Candidatus Dormibacteraeota bacterium]
MTADIHDPRRALMLGLLRTALARVDGRRCVREALAAQPLPARMRVHVAAVGKAATSMALGALEALGGAIERLLVITRDDLGISELTERAQAEVHLSAHPLPDERSLAAGQRLIAWMDELPREVWPLFLISGGSSALVEVP